MKVDHNIQSLESNWSFGGDVPQEFVPHIRRSIPGYDRGHEICAELSSFFCLENSICYDLGTSTGELIKKLATHNQHTKGVQWIGIDSVPEMVAAATAHCAELDNITITHDDIVAMDYEKADLITAYYTIQFVPPRRRQELYSKLYQALNWGGALIVFEKVRGPDARFQDILTQVYTEYKLKNGFSSEEIINKAKSLKSVLDPFSTNGNMTLLQNAGFSDITTVFKDLCFEGYLAIK